jgi:hypothetical protein
MPVDYPGRSGQTGAVLSPRPAGRPCHGVQAQEADQKQAPEFESEHDDTGMLGLLGLADLIALAGLARRDRQHDPYRGIRTGDRDRDRDRDRMASR